jgi:hypothetical protein
VTRTIARLTPICLALCLACERGTAPSPSPSNPTDSVHPEPFDFAQDRLRGAESKGPIPLPVTLTVAVVSGQDLTLSREAVTLLEPGSSFRVEVAAHLADGRLALHDEQDAMVASTGTTEVGATWTKFQLVPVEPLRPGSKYSLHLDGAATREPHDDTGRAFAPLIVNLMTAGERPAAPKKAHPKRRRH